MLQNKEEKSDIQNKNLNLPKAMHDDSIPLLQCKQEPSRDIIIQHPFEINLDDDIDIGKIDEQLHNDLNSFFFSSMNVNDDKSIELGACPN